MPTLPAALPTPLLAGEVSGTEPRPNGKTKGVLVHPEKTTGIPGSMDGVQKPPRRRRASLPLDRHAVFLRASSGAWRSFASLRRRPDPRDGSRAE